MNDLCLPWWSPSQVITTIYCVCIRFRKRIEKPSYVQGASANGKETTCGSVHHWLHTPHLAILRARASVPQPSVVIFLYILAAPHFTYPNSLNVWNLRVKIVRSSDGNFQQCHTDHSMFHCTWRRKFAPFTFTTVSMTISVLPVFPHFADLKSWSYVNVFYGSIFTHCIHLLTMNLCNLFIHLGVAIYFKFGTLSSVLLLKCPDGYLFQLNCCTVNNVITYIL